MRIQMKGSACSREAPDVILHVRESLREYVESENFAGFDPYDALSGWVPFHWGGSWTQVVATQIQKRNPLNFRKVMGIPKERNPKGIGLFLAAYCRLAENEKDESGRRVADELFEWLVANRSPGMDHYCWGYNFDWVSPRKKIAAGVPSVVVTAFVAKGVFNYFHLTGNQRARDVLLSCCEYVLTMLPRTVFPEGVCFSYTHLFRDCCYNANMLAAEVLAMGHYLSGVEEWADLAIAATDFTLAHQKEDGRWHYSRDCDNLKERTQLDFHQGFVLDSLDAIIRLIKPSHSRYTGALAMGASFYRQAQFFEEGRSKWRLPREWPVDIHNQAQGILSFTRLRHLDSAYYSFARAIAGWTIDNMWDERGFFYYQRFPQFVNKISYIRWAQSWMFLALVEATSVERHLEK